MTELQIKFIKCFDAARFISELHDLAESFLYEPETISVSVRTNEKDSVFRLAEKTGASKSIITKVLT